MNYFPALLLCTLILLTSCVKHRDLINFNQGAAFPAGPSAMPPAPPVVIQPDDLLSIQVFISDLDGAQAVAPFNLGGSGNMANSAISSSAGFLVDNQGMINYPGLGALHLDGLTLAAARDTIANKLRAYLREPIVNIRFLNFKYTVLGVVKSPGTYTTSRERITILEAVGSTGDLTEYANRTNILVIREQNGQREFGHLNLQDRAIFMSPYFYLRQNDVIYVEPIPARVATVSDKFNKVLPYLSAGITVINLIVIVTRLNN
jgi:polysaccharide export outer membrane protein